MPKRDDMSLSSSAAPIGVHFYGCLQPANLCSPSSFWGTLMEEGERFLEEGFNMGSPHLLIEEMGWKTYAVGSPKHRFDNLDLQRAIHAIGNEMERRMQLGYGMGRCVLLIKNRLLSQLTGFKGCIKITRTACQALQDLFLSSWRELLITCLKGESQCSEEGQCKNLDDICREMKMEWTEETREKYFYEKAFRSTLKVSPEQERLFLSTLEEKVSVEARELSWPEDEKNVPNLMQDKALSTTVLAIPWKTFQRDKDHKDFHVNVEITYVSTRETDDIPKGRKPAGSVEIFVTDKGFFMGSYLISVVNEEALVEEVGKLILEFDAATLKHLRLPNRLLHLNEFKNALVQSALLSEDPAIQAMGIKWQKKLRKAEEERRWWAEEEQLSIERQDVPFITPKTDPSKESVVAI